MLLKPVIDNVGKSESKEVPGIDSDESLIDVSRFSEMD
jgi:hypothetical protein